jgi:uncharacterized membrane protein
MRQNKMKPRVRSILKWAGIGVIVLFVLAQAVRPARTNPPVLESKTLEATGSPTPEVSAILNRACKDCHSNKTVWPWYSNVAPVSWLLVDHVNEGRRELNLSNWSDYNERRASKKLEEICEQVRDHEMPIGSYLLIHSEAKLTDEDRRLLCEWATRERQRLQVESSEVK